MDIEELVADGARDAVRVPTTVLAHSLKEADLIFAPYNYVLDERHRNTSGVNWRGSIIILDEAHNVASVAEDAASFSLTSVDLAGALQEVDRAVSAAPRQELASNVDGGEGLQIGEDELLSLKRIVLGLEDALMNTKHLEEKGGALHEKILTPAGLTCAAAGAWFADACKRAGDVVQADARGSGNAAPKLELLERACTLAFRGDAQCKALADDHYRIRIASEQGRSEAGLLVLLARFSFARSAQSRRIFSSMRVRHLITPPFLCGRTRFTTIRQLTEPPRRRRGKRFIMCCCRFGAQ